MATLEQQLDDALVVAESDEHSCFNCDDLGGGFYRQHEGKTIWYIGLAEDGMANYACEGCKDLLFKSVPVSAGF